MTDRPGQHEPHAADLAVVRRAKAREPGALAAFMHHMRCVRRILTIKNRGFGRPLDDAALEDVIQDTLIAIWERLDRYEGKGSLEAWAYRFCQLTLLSRMRALRQVPSVESLSEVELTTLEEDDLTGALRQERVYRALDRLDAADADVLRARFLEDLSFDEIARRDVASKTAVRSRYYRALTRLRTLMQPSPAPSRDQETTGKETLR